VRERLAAGGIAAGSPLRVASVTKTITAATALRLVEDGDLELDAALDGPWDVTLREALGHRGGLPDVFSRLLALQLAPGGPPARSGPWDPAEMIDLVAREPRTARGAFRPGRPAPTSARSTRRSTGAAAGSSPPPTTSCAWSGACTPAGWSARRRFAR
jgi:CubicO group peptidase (beta-lactamase class C family)